MIEDGGITIQEFDMRIKNCLAEMEIKNIDVMLVYGHGTRPGNLVYMTNFRPIGFDKPGYSNYNGIFLLHKSGEATLVIDRDWYLDWAEEESWVTDVVADSQGDSLSLAYDILKKRKLLKARIEADCTQMNGEFYHRFSKTFSGCDIDDESRIVARLREVKSPKEIELISKGLEILGKAHDAAVAMGKEGVREIDIALEIRRTIHNEGAEFPSALFVLAGRRSTIALANPMASEYRLKHGDMVLVSPFCIYKKYSAGMDRNWVVGAASERQRTLADIELKTIEKAIGMVKPGVKASDFMKPVYTDFAEPLLKEAGFTDYNTQGYAGHGTGLEIFETPVLWKLDPCVLRPGMVIDMETGIYSKDPKIGGIRTAEFVVVTETGCKMLTKYPRRIGTLA